jgi:hypothetical protein
MNPETIRRLDIEKLRVLHRNCLLNLLNPVRSDQARELINLLHHEFVRRATQESGGQFVPMLSCVGYNVRWKDLETRERRSLIDWVLHSELPQINNAQFMSKWGSPGSKRRFRCLYDTIQGYCDRYGQEPLMEVASARWKSDLDYIVQQGRLQRNDDPSWRQ